MINSKESFKEQYSQQLHQIYGRPFELCDNAERYEALVRLIRIIGGDINIENNLSDREDKKVYYFSMEFLIGKLLENYLINLGIRDYVAEGLEEMGESLENICECESDPGLGNGGLFAGIYFAIIWTSIIRNTTVFESNDAIGIFFGKVWIVGDHNDETILGDVFENIHNLNASLGI